jgi:uncharacterized UBP type Zn finger protein
MSTQTQNATCEHLVQAHDRGANTPSECEECLQSGDTWVQLRLCLECGHVGCCDSSKNKHATKHFTTTHHPVIEAYGSEQRWRWCYIDQIQA